MNIPKTIKIGSNEFKIKNKFNIDWNGNIAGQINFSKNRILLKKGSNHRCKEDTFFHEVAHGIFKEISYNYPQIIKFSDNESFIQEFGLLLRKTFLDLLDKQELIKQNDKTK